MQITDERIREFQEIYKKEFGKELSWEEAAEGARNLLGFVEIAYKQTEEEYFRNQKLEKNQKGFHLDDGKTYNCCICRESISNEQTWYDKSGIKCLHCQNAIERKIIPKSIFKKEDSWYSAWEFSYYFNIKAQTVKKLIRQGKLKARIIPNINTKQEHFKIFLLKDNIDVLPKKPESFLVKDKNGMTHVEYERVDISKLTGEENKKNHLEVNVTGK